MTFARLQNDVDLWYMEISGFIDLTVSISALYTVGIIGSVQTEGKYSRKIRGSKGDRLTCKEGALG